MSDTRRSKRLSYWLRHAPEAGGLQLDHSGWASVDAILKALNDAYLPTTIVELKALVARSEKQRFELSLDDNRIRARQGHSIKVQGDWPIAVPPELLFHGTAERFLHSMLERGLLPGARHHVHLSSTIETARVVEARRGSSVVLSITASKMAKDDYTFRLSSKRRVASGACSARLPREARVNRACEGPLSTHCRHSAFKGD
jgi:putative RNA 2'-phosphotransferase